MDSLATRRTDPVTTDHVKVEEDVAPTTPVRGNVECRLGFDKRILAFLDQECTFHLNHHGIDTTRIKDSEIVCVLDILVVIVLDNSEIAWVDSCLIK